MNRPSFLRQEGNEGVLRPLVAAVAAVALVLGLVAALVPGVGDVVANTVGVFVGSPVLVVLIAMGGGAYGLLQLYRTGADESEPNPLVGLAPERAHYDENAITGDDIDKSVEAVGGELPESDAKDWWTYREKNDVRSSLEAVAGRVLANEHDVGREAATRLLETGEWTDDPRASAFLGTDTPDLPLKLQFFDWLSGEAYQRRVEATVEAIARHAGVATGGDAEAGDGRTATGSALPVHTATETERIRAAAAELAPDEPSTSDGGPSSMADVRLDGPPGAAADAGTSTASTANASDAADHGVAADDETLDGASTDDADADGSSAGGEDAGGSSTDGEDADASVELAAEGGGETT
ncbi:hypothetical protein [Halorubellus sp. PRR65]|uniref:DUF7269 family protein n=1 Tax=Halorubellus sp. PRR65 TaxID=3098148 RepID=UPI002B261087|nr:hypothetical protein [Halorubellus sp. PRR65]